MGSTVIMEWVKILLPSAITIIGVIIAYNKRMAILETKFEELTREVREHNNFAKRMPVVENEIKHINDRIDKIS